MSPNQNQVLKTSDLPRVKRQICTFKTRKCPWLIERNNILPRPSVLKPHLHLSRSQVQLLGQSELLLLQGSKPSILNKKIPKYPLPRKSLSPLFFFLRFPGKTNVQTTYWIERVVLFEVFFENRGLILGESELLSRSVAVFFIADSARTSPLQLMFVSDGFSLTSFPAHAGNRAVWWRNAGLLFAVDRRWQAVHIYPTEKWSGVASEWLWGSICSLFISWNDLQ